ncbi:MAG TPA: hypothetical protein VF765_27800 [Polyangiaceae bacterium]
MKRAAPLLAVLLLSLPAGAQQPPQPPLRPIGMVQPRPGPAPATQPRPQGVRRAAPKPPAALAGPKPDVKLLLDAPTTHGPWTMHVVNDGDIPVRLVADARMLALEVTPRGARKPVRCQLPADMRPADDSERAVVLPPKRSYSESFEPRLYCFGERELDALTATSIVVARLGWPERAGAHGPYAVSGIEGVEPEVAPLAAIESPPVSLPDEPTPMPADEAARAPDDPDPVHLSLRASRAVDAESPENLGVTVTVHNDGRRAVRLRFRPETLGFEVTSNSGVQRCGWPTSPSAPAREYFTTLAAGASESLTVLLGDYCGRAPFDSSGLVVVRPDLDTRRAGGGAIGLKTFDGVVIASTPTVVRLHRGNARPRSERPRLDPPK